MEAGFFDDLLPMPRAIRRLAGVPAPRPAGVAFALRGLNAGQTAAFHRLASLVFKDRPGRAPVLPVAVRLAPARAPAELKGVSGPLRAESYELVLKASGAVLTAGCFQGFYGGLQTLRQLLENSERLGPIPACRIVDWPRLARRGLHYDLAREMEYRPEHLMRVLENMAYFKMNTLHLYLENRFGYASAPAVVPPGVITPGQARALCDYGRALGITVIPQIPTLGHMEHFLTGPYRPLRESPVLPDNLCPSHPQARPFLAGLIADVARAFRPPYIHIGYDESRSGFCGRCRRRGTPPQLLARHLNWLQGEVGRHGARAMIYGDMFLPPSRFPRTDAANGGTEAEASAALRRVSRDIIITDWHYTAPYGGTVRYFVENGFEVHAVTAAPVGALRVNRGHHWIVAGTDRAATEGALGAFNSNWEFHRGQFFDNFWFFQGLAAERQWTDRPHDYLAYGGRFSSRFWGVDRDYYSSLGSLLETIPDQGRPWLFDSHVLEPLPARMRFDTIELAGCVRDRAAALRRRARRNRDTLRALDMPAIILEYLGQRALGMTRVDQALSREQKRPALAALGTVRRSAQAVSDGLQRGYRHYGGAVVDRQRIEEQLRALDCLRDLLGDTAASRLPALTPARRLHAVNQRLQDAEMPGPLRAFTISPLLPAARDIRRARPPGKSIPFAPPEHNYPATGQYPVLETAIVDIRQAHRGQDGLVYLRSAVRLKKGGAGTLFYGADGPVKVFVNGAAVGCQPQATNPLAADGYACAVAWRPGVNDVVLAIDTHGGQAWGVQARVALD